MPTLSEYQIFSMNGVRYPCVPVSGYANTGTMEGKVVDGDYTRDSDKVMSSKIWTDLTGGIGKDRIREGADEGRYWFGLAQVDRPYQWALPEKIETYAEAYYPLGDVGTTFYAADADLNIYSWDPDDKEFTDTTADLTDVPTFKGTLWNGSLYIPQRANGYTAYLPATTVDDNASPQVVDFIVWDNRLFCITVDGELKYTLNGTSWITTGTLDSSVTPKHLSLYFDRSDNEVIVVVGQAGLWMYDPAAFRFVRSRVRIPPHPDNGLGVDVWRPGEDLFFSAGLQVYRYTGAATVPMGPDRSDGVPDELRGRVVDLCAEHNSLVALVEGVSVTADGGDDAEFDPGMSEDEELEFSATTAVTSVLAWTGSGWQVRWISSSNEGTPTWCCTSAYDYRVWWGWGDVGYSLPLSRSFANVSARWRTGEIEFEETGYLDLGWVDHNMREFSKLASHVEVNLENGTDTEYIRVLYKIDNDMNWTELGQTEPAEEDCTSCQTILPFGIETLDDGTLFSRGQEYKRIRLRLEFVRGSDAGETPIVDSIVLKHIRLPLTGQVFTFTLPLDFDEFEGRSIPEIKSEIDELLASPQFVRLEHGYAENQLSHRVRIGRLGGQDQTGLNPLGGRSLTIIAIPLDGYDGTDLA